MPHDRTTSTNCPWQLLEEHFLHQARVVSHFKNADGRAVIAMWRTGTNEAGVRLSRFELDALLERHCELFGRWPEDKREHAVAVSAELRGV